MIVKRMRKMVWRAWLTTVAFTLPVALGLLLADVAAQYNLGYIAVILGIGGFTTGGAFCIALWEEWADQETCL